MEYPLLSNCSVCGKKMAQFRATKMYCGRKCQQRAYRVRNGLPLTWTPDPTKKNSIRQDDVRFPLNWNKPHNGLNYECQILETDKGVRKIYVNKSSGEIYVFKLEDGKEVLL